MRSNRKPGLSSKELCAQERQTSRTGVKLTILTAVAGALFLVACGSGGGASSGPPTAGASEWFFVDNFSGDVIGFSTTSGKLAPIPGSSALFAPVLSQFAVEPGGTFLAAIETMPQGASTLEIATIAHGGAIALARLTNGVTSPGGLAISSKGVLAVTDRSNATVQLMAFDNGLFFLGASAATGAIPQDLTFSPDGKTLYVGNDGDGTISVFSVSNLAGSLQLVQTAHLPVSLGEFTPAVVRVRVDATGSKLAATSPDGRIFVGEVRPLDGTLTSITRTIAAPGANLEEAKLHSANLNGADLSGADLSSASLNAS